MQSKKLLANGKSQASATKYLLCGNCFFAIPIAIEEISIAIVLLVVIDRSFSVPHPTISIFLYPCPFFFKISEAHLL